MPGMKFLLTLLVGFVQLFSTVTAAWGYTDNGSGYVIDTGADLVFTVSKTNGDLTSFVYNGVEYQGYEGKNSAVQSGLGDSTVTIKQYTTPVNMIQVTITYETLVHTYVARYKYNNIYMLTNKGDATVPALRYIVRVKPNILPKAVTDSDYYITPSTVVEASDVTLSTEYDTTHSKHYQGSNYGRTIDYDYVGKATSTVGIWLIRSNHEKASGGPFFRSLLRGCTTVAEDLYEILYYNMGTTDAERWGLQGPYVLSFTTGAEPDTALYARNADYSWMDTLGIKGWVADTARGSVSAVGIANQKSGYNYTAALSNTDAQYWGSAWAGSGFFHITKVIPGTYTLSVFKGEYAVYTTSVVITAGENLSLNTITPNLDPSDTTALWRIGDWDGTPSGFTNFDVSPMLPTYMHPSDKRLASWTPPNYTVGTSTASGSMPGYIWNDVNNGHVVYFKLGAGDTAISHTVRIGITEAYAGGRPQITVNSWTSTAPAASDQAKTRSLTVGTYRGTNAMFTYTVPSSAFVATGGWNALYINIISGSSGTGYLSPGVSLDAIDFI